MALIESERLLPDLVAWARANDPEGMEKAVGSFELAKDTKEVAMDEEGCTVRISTELSPK